MVAKDGRIVWFHDESVSMHDADGEPLLLAGRDARRHRAQAGGRAAPPGRGAIPHGRHHRAQRGRAACSLRPRSAHRALRSTSPRSCTPRRSTPAPRSLRGPQVERSWAFTPISGSTRRLLDATICTPTTWRGVVRDQRSGERDRGSTFLDRVPVPRRRRPRTAGSTTRPSACSTTTGAPLFWQGVMLDITEQKERSRTCAEADERYRALVEHIPAVVYPESPEADPAKFYISPQVTTCSATRPTNGRWTADFWRDRVHPDDAERGLRRRRALERDA